MTPSELVVSPVLGRADARAFCKLPYRLYRRDPHWVAPLHAEERRRWSPRHNASLGGRWVERFLARRGGRVVGRVAAIEDRAFAARWRPGAAFFGFFECDGDPEAARALLAAAEAALAARGARVVLGPVNLTTHEEVGVLAAGFDHRPSLLTPYNPRGYLALLEHNGYRTSAEYHAYRWTRECRRSPAVERLAAAAARRRGAFAKIAVRSMEAGQWDREVTAIHELYNASFASVWGFTPLTRKEFDERAGAFRPFYRPELVLFAQLDGRPVGFALVLPDVHEVLARLDGRLLPFGWLRLVHGIPRIRSGRFILMGIRPELAGRGIAPVLAVEMAKNAERLRLAAVEISLVLATNRKMRRVIEAFGCVPSKTYRLYEKSL